MKVVRHSVPAKEKWHGKTTKGAIQVIQILKKCCGNCRTCRTGSAGPDTVVYRAIMLFIFWLRNIF